MIRYYPLNQLDVLLILNAHLPRHVEIEIVSILVLLISLVLRLLHVQLTTTEQDVSVPQDMKEMDFHLVQRSEKENVSTTWIVLITEHVSNINVSTLAIY